MRSKIIKILLFLFIGLECLALTNRERIEKDLRKLNINDSKIIAQTITIDEKIGDKLLQGEGVEVLLKDLKSLVAENPKNFYISYQIARYYLETEKNIDEVKKNKKYFDLYKKNKRTIENLIEQIEIAKQDLGYFETIKFQIENADKTDIAEIKEELIANGILKEKIKVNKKKNKSNYFVINHNGTDIYVGKNNLQNDAITNKLARRDYLWFHAKDIPGSHVVIFDNNPSEETIEVASMLAAYYSKFKNEEYVNVDRTLIKNVKKISGAKPGLVTYTGQKTVKQKIDKNLIGELLIK